MSVKEISFSGIKSEIVKESIKEISFNGIKSEFIKEHVKEISFSGIKSEIVTKDEFTVIYTKSNHTMTEINRSYDYAILITPCLIMPLQ